MSRSLRLGSGREVAERVLRTNTDDYSCSASGHPKRQTCNQMVTTATQNTLRASTVNDETDAEMPEKPLSENCPGQLDCPRNQEAEIVCLFFNLTTSMTYSYCVLISSDPEGVKPPVVTEGGSRDKSILSLSSQCF